MKFSKQIDEYFLHVVHQGVCDHPCESILHGNPGRSQVHLSIKQMDQGHQARFLASGGVVLIACCEYWARAVEETGVICLNVESCLDELLIDSTWRADVMLVAQATERLAHACTENH